MGARGYVYVLRVGDSKKKKIPGPTKNRYIDKPECKDMKHARASWAEKETRGTITLANWLTGWLVTR